MPKYNNHVQQGASEASPPACNYYYNTRYDIKRRAVAKYSYLIKTNSSFIQLRNNRRLIGSNLLPMSNTMSSAMSCSRLEVYRMRMRDLIGGGAGKMWVQRT